MAARLIVTLFIVPTPIGNLEDITLRALRVLREVPLILAEDTRHSRKLLAHFGISTPLRPYHQHNKRHALGAALAALDAGDVALVSDSGMPSIADPGFELIGAALEAGHRVDVLPGPSAVVTAVVAAALPAPGFLFAGFLPRQHHERVRRLQQVAALPYALVLYEAPHRLLETLRDIHMVFGDRHMAAARELSKVHQEVVRGGVTTLIEYFEAHEPRGEFTLVLSGAEERAQDRTAEAREAMERLRGDGLDARTAVSAVAATYDIPRNEAYRLWLDTAGQ